MLIRLGNEESHCQALSERVENLESVKSISEDQVKQIARQELIELKETESRKSNIMVFNLPETYM